MTEYISREAALELLKKIEYKESSLNVAGSMICAIRDMPAADVVEVVRCRTCRHFEATGLTEVTGCGFCFHDSRMIRIVQMDGFCYEGMRREAEA